MAKRQPAEPLARTAPPAARPGGHVPFFARLESGRLRLVQGPIDLVLDIAGPGAAVARSEAMARAAFKGLLASLVAELPLLRSPAGPGAARPSGPVARAMADAVAPFAPWFVTPMAAVAGAVADHIALAARSVPGLTRVAVNNGGDIALHLTEGARCRIGISDYHVRAAVVEIAAGDGIGGVATSGWHGRSHSLGIADAVTVLTDTAAGADAAATMIANAVDLPGSAKVERRTARDLAPDSDLGDRLVTVGVGALDRVEKTAALDAGEARAREVIAMGRARAVFLALQGECRSIGEREGTGWHRPISARS